MKLHHAELRDLKSLIHVMKFVWPDRIFHLAAESYVLDSFLPPPATLKVNVIGASNLLDAVRWAEIEPLIPICPSSEVYGQAREDEAPVKGFHSFRPASPYAVSKVGEDMVALQYFLSYGMKTIRTRMFTHTGPRRGDVFAESRLARQIAEIELGLTPDNVVRFGNLDSVRTIADAQDSVRAYWLLPEKCQPGEVYNIGGEEKLTVGKILELLKKLMECPIRHDVDSAQLRPSDVTLQVPETKNSRNSTGSRPKIEVKKTFEDLLNYHREMVRLDANRLTKCK